VLEERVTLYTAFSRARTRFFKKLRLCVGSGVLSFFRERFQILIRF